jgi:erythromycin esterase-like protein
MAPASRAAEATDAAHALARELIRFDDPAGAVDAVLDVVGERRLVLLGEASHGTHEFYALRAGITRRLIEQRGLDAVAVEADWPDAYRVNCFVAGAGDDRSAGAALGDFRRFPGWMWRNLDVRDFVGWLRDHNERAGERVGFYGLDLYSLHASIEAVLRYLDEVDPPAARRARLRYACFEHVDGADPQRYGYATMVGGADPCEADVIEQLVDLQRSAATHHERDGRVADDAQFFAEQNARLVRNAERYYRAMYRGRAESWNLRDEHMTETLATLADRIERQRGRPARIAVWAHNSHLGDARATEMADHGERNVGQLVRERWGAGDVCLVGFTTDRGTVTAASDWGGAAERKRVRRALAGSHEQVFAGLTVPAFVLPLEPVAREWAGSRLERAIGVIYRPETERQSHYFHARLPDQFDAIVHIDETTAVEPLDRTDRWVAGDTPETFPTGV